VFEKDYCRSDIVYCCCCMCWSVTGRCCKGGLCM